MVGFHGLEVQSLLVFVGGEDSEGGLVRESPVWVCPVLIENLLLIWDVVVLVGCGVDVKGHGKPVVALQSCTFVVTFESFLAVAFGCFGGVALDFCFEVLAIAGDEEFERARLRLLAGIRGMTGLFAWVAASFLRLAARLLTSSHGVFTLSWSMALLLAVMGAAFQFLSTN